MWVRGERERETFKWKDLGTGLAFEDAKVVYLDESRFNIFKLDNWCAAWDRRFTTHGNHLAAEFIQNPIFMNLASRACVPDGYRGASTKLGYLSSILLCGRSDYSL